MDNDDFYYDDPQEESAPTPQRSKFFKFSVAGLILAGTLGTTLAANISINNSGPAEFGQGILTTTACSGNTKILLEPQSSFDGSKYLLKSIKFSNIPPSCAGNDFAVNASDSDEILNGSAVLGGSASSYINLGSSSGFDFGTGTFTIEGWYKFTNVSPSPTSTALWQMQNGNAFFMLINRQPYVGRLSLYYNYTPTTGYPFNFADTADNTITTNRWTHIAAMRNGNTYSLYVDGKCVAVNNNVSTYTMGSSALDLQLGVGVPGSVTNFRVVKGSLVYPYGTTVGTTYFTPSMSVLPPIAGTTALLPTPFGSNFLDNISGNSLTITNVGSVTSSSSSPFSGSSTLLPPKIATLYGSNSTTANIYFDGTTFTRGLNSTGTTITTHSSSPTGSFTLTFDSPLAQSARVANLTLQSAPHA